MHQVGYHGVFGHVPWNPRFYYVCFLDCVTSSPLTEDSPRQLWACHIQGVVLAACLGCTPAAYSCSGKADIHEDLCRRAAKAPKYWKRNYVLVRHQAAVSEKASLSHYKLSFFGGMEHVRSWCLFQGSTR